MCPTPTALVTPVVTRSMAAIDELRRTGDPTTGDDNQDETKEIDHLANIDAVLRGERRVRTQVVLTRLAELHPAIYEGWTFSNLIAAPAEYGIEPVKSGGVKVVRAADVIHALTHRDRQKGAEGNNGQGT
jgi:DNA segregation ATPase FtsK/SpoIIIE, S-DNA-T family